MKVYSKDFAYLYFITRWMRWQVKKVYVGVGMLTLELPIDSDAAYFIEKNGWIVDDYDEPFIVKYIKQGMTKITVKAYSGHKLLQQRITGSGTGKKTTVTKTGGPDEVVKYFINQSKGDLPITTADVNSGTSISDQTRLKNLGDEVSRILVAAERGELFTLTEDEGITFDTFAGVDRTAGNAESNPAAIFALKFKNLEEYDYVIDGTKEQSTVYVGGAGEGDDREIYVAGDAAEGVDRTEIFKDARDVDEGDTDTLTERAAQFLISESITVDAKAVAVGNLIYGTDYSVGDIVTTKVPVKSYEINGKFYDRVDETISVNQRISEVVLTNENGQLDVDLTFGAATKIDAAVTAVKKDVEQLNATGNHSEHKKLLWSGSWSSGNITVPNTANYSLFLIDGGGYDAVLAWKFTSTSEIRGIGGYYHGIENAQYIVGFEASFSGNTWTLDNYYRMYHYTSGSHSAAAAKTAVKIYGLL